MAEFGYHTIGGSTAANGGEYIVASKETLAEAGDVSKLSMYVDATAFGASFIAGVIYADNSGSPGTLEAFGIEQELAAGFGVGWYDLNFAVPVALEPGDYWIGVQFGGTVNFLRYNDTLTDNLKYKQRNWALGQLDPFGTPDGTTSERVSIYATYTPDATTARIRTPKRLVGPTLVTNSPVTGYTVPATYITRMRHVHISNPSGSPVDMTLSIGTDAAATRLLDGKPIAADSVYEMACDEALAAGEIVQISASSTNVLTITISGEEWVPA